MNGNMIGWRKEVLKKIDIADNLIIVVDPDGLLKNIL